MTDWELYPHSVELVQWLIRSNGNIYLDVKKISYPLQAFKKLIDSIDNGPEWDGEVYSIGQEKFIELEFENTDIRPESAIEGLSLNDIECIFGDEVTWMSFEEIKKKLVDREVAVKQLFEIICKSVLRTQQQLENFQKYKMKTHKDKDENKNKNENVGNA